MNAVMVNAQAAFSQMVAEVAAVIERRDNLLLTTQSELATLGHGSVVVDQVDRYPFTPGQKVTVWRDIHPRYVCVTVGRTDGQDDRWGPYAFCDGWVQESIGFHTVLVADSDKVLLVADGEPSDAQFSRAVARVRRLAKSEQMRVRVRGTVVEVVSPFGDVVHEGDVTSAFCWLSGIEITAAHA